MKRAASATAVARWLTPPELAKQVGIDPAKVLAWIASGELPAANMASPGRKRPRYWIDPCDFEVFRLRKKKQAPAPPTRRPRRQSAGGVEYF